MHSFTCEILGNKLALVKYLHIYQIYIGNFFKTNSIKFFFENKQPLRKETECEDAPSVCFM